MNNNNMFMVRGDTFRFSVEIENLQEDLTSAYFSCKKNYDDVEYIFQKSLGDGITKKQTTETSKIYEVVVAPEDTENVECGNYFYDLQIAVNGDIYTPLNAILKIEKDVTVNSVTPSA
jgi:hypothetical protein